MKKMITSVIALMLLVFTSTALSQDMRGKRLYEVKNDTVNKKEVQKVTRSNSSNQLNKVDVSKFDTHNRHGSNLSETESLANKKGANLNRVDNNNPELKEIKEVKIVEVKNE